MVRYLLPLLSLCLLFACDPTGAESPTPTPTDSFDRGAMLESWMDDVVIPAQTDFISQLQQLNERLATLEDLRNGPELEATRLAFAETYLAWQRYSPFILAEGETVRLRERTNTYPTNTASILANLTAGDANLDLPSNTDAQGLPALEYLLHQYGEDHSDATNHTAALGYATAVGAKLEVLHTETERQLIANRDAYVENTGNSVTGSIDRTVNDFIFHYEKYLRAGKVGIPAGVFSDAPLADRVESRYAGDSKALFLEALSAAETFFDRRGLADYLDALNVSAQGELLSASIGAQFASIRAATTGVQEDFGQQVATDNVAMLRLYDELQKLTVLLKVDMLQALSINVDYVDADGD